MKELSSKMRALGWIMYHIADVGLGNKFLDVISTAPD